MPDHSIDVTTPDHANSAATRGAGPMLDRAVRREASHRLPHPRADWRLGGRTVSRWREWLLATALFSLGVAILAGTLLSWLWPTPEGAASATAVLWMGMLVPVVWALSRSRPAGLLRFRLLDLLYGVALAGALRVIQGWLEVAAGGSGALPAYPLVNGELSGIWWFTDVVSVITIAPVVEEFYFRAVILVALYTVLRRPFGQVAAGLVAVVISTGLFVLLHGLAGGESTDQVVSLALLGLACGMLVVLTGRIWGAVLAHVGFNLTFVVISLAGAFLV
ncbi:MULTISPECIES: type II CAAX endopeptidase family protein [unclassified Microbacterium]|uniref:CPBP family intramembrane glutamic endopeptidase n=1 Tax=unclassified Microbacterium TaxID=2609290 RepID=UPI00214B4C25|nr:MULTISPECIES: type II CAAX endopeptidase family protein [unclassified Microbacterium]MCR2808908.1 CPBP family intramembrane metalloprotease [Microbacterium sp. zg.B185]WIM18673.1 type II CAAX endopeptidase family protein [Microbacterium sp. zg-B185]